MKITASRRDDILRQRDEYNAEKARRDARYKEQSNRFRKATYDVIQPVKDEVQTYLKEYNLLEFDVFAEMDYLSGKIRLTVNCNERHKFSDESALSWHFEARLNKDGEVLKETGSWSGLKACTEAQLASLEQSLEALKLLNQIDWAYVLNKILPDTAEYFKIPEGEQPLPPKPDFRSQLVEASISECVGKDILVEGEAGSSSGYRAGCELYYLIHSETPKQYVVSEVVKSWADGWIESGQKTIEQLINEVRSNYTYRVTKSKFVGLVSFQGDDIVKLS